MNLEKQVATQELSKKLKDLGVEQDSHLYWWDDYRSYPALLSAKSLDDGVCSAFTSAELGEMLGNMQYTRQNHSDCKYKWTCYNELSDSDFQADTEADARAKCLIFLLENKN